MNKYEEALRFYCANNYIIINNLLWDNKQKIETGMQIIVDDAKGCMKEAEEMGIENRWYGTPEECQQIYDAYKRRTPNILDEAGKRKVLNQAKEDMDSLYTMMQPCDKDLTLFRNVRASDFKNHFVGEKIIMKGFSSCSKTKCEESYSAEQTFFRLTIVIPKGTNCIDASLYPNYCNEQDEVVLPPFECVVKNIEQSSNPNCIYEVEVTFIKSLKPNNQDISYEKIFIE